MIKGELTLDLALCDIKLGCHDIFKLYEEQMTMKNLQCNLNFSSKAPKEIFIDAKKYKQVLLIIVQNAVKFTDTGGFDV